MRTSDRTLLVSLALAATLPAAALAQEAEVVDPGPAIDPALLSEEDALAEETIVTADSAAALSEPATLEGWSYDEVYASGISINEILGADVYGPDEDDIGDVENVLFDLEGNVLSIIAEIGGFLDLGDTHVNIPWEMVSAEEWEDGVIIPFDEDDIEDNIVAYEEVVTPESASEVQEVSGDGPGVVDTAEGTWRATDMIGDFARLREGDGFVNQGLVDDIVVQDGRIAAMVVSPDPAGLDSAPGIYGFPYAGQAGWNDAEGVYDMPYERAEAERLQPFDPAMLTD